MVINSYICVGKRAISYNTDMIYCHISVVLIITDTVKPYTIFKLPNSYISVCLNIALKFPFYALIMLYCVQLCFYYFNYRALNFSNS